MRYNNPREGVIWSDDVYEKDGICYAGELVESITITAARPTGFGVLVITFSTGE